MVSGEDGITLAPSSAFILLLGTASIVAKELDILCLGTRNNLIIVTGFCHLCVIWRRDGAESRQRTRGRTPVVQSIEFQLCGTDISCKRPCWGNADHFVEGQALILSRLLTQMVFTVRVRMESSERHSSYRWEK